MLCFRKFPRAKKFMDQRPGGECQAFPAKVFCLTVKKNFVEEHFCAAFHKFSASEKVYR